MSDNIKNETIKKETGDNQQHHCQGKRPGRMARGIFGTFALIGVITVGGAIGATVFGSSCGYAHGGGHFSGKMNVAEMSERMTDRLLKKVDASDEQELQVKAIVQQYQPQLESMKGFRSEQRDTFKQILVQDTVNPNDIEAARAQALQHLGESSVVLSQMLGDIANVLSKEQRIELVESFGKYRRHW